MSSVQLYLILNLPLVLQPFLFLGLSYLLRVLEGVGGAAVWATLLAILLAR